MSASEIGLCAGAAILLFWVVGAYNRLVSLRNGLVQAYSQIDLQMRQRYEVVPELVVLAGRYLEHERPTLEALTAACHQAGVAVDRARARPGRPGELAALALAEQVFSGALRRLVALVENYPELQSESQVRTLIDDLAIGESKLRFSAQIYNDAASTFNAAARQFPTNIVAALFGFSSAGLLSFPPGEGDRAATRPLP